jgi:serine protease Do
MSKIQYLRPTVVLIAVGLLGGLLMLGRPTGASSDDVDDAQAIQQARSLSHAFRAAARKVIPTVVKVKTTTNPRQIRPRSPRANPFRGTPFEDFFDDDPGFRMIPDVPTPGLGSGVIIDSSGIVLTNNHVVSGADEVVVQLSDGREYPAEDIKTDDKTDLAVLRIKTDEPLPAAQLGDSDKLEIGDWVIAVGNPFELESTVSAGIISAKGRTLRAVDRARFLQTDAAINPGNSGGPLVNLDGQVIGVNTAIASRSGGYQGIGFAIPINTAKWVTPQLVETGTVRRAYIGVSIEEITAERARELGVRPNQGVAVREVFPESPAEAADLREDDVIVSFDQQPIRTASDLQQVVERSAADSRHAVAVLRDGKPLTLQVVVKAMPDEFGVASSRATTGEFYQDRRLGLVVIELTRTMAEQLGYREKSGALIVHSDRQRIAYRAGIRDGMLIMKVNDESIESVADYQEAMESASLQEGIELTVLSRRGVETVTLKAD